MTQEVCIEYKRGKLIGKEGNLWLVDTGDTIIKSPHEPVTHKFPEGYYLHKDKTISIRHDTAWFRDGALTPVYKYTDSSKPPFGSNHLVEKDVAALEKVESPFLAEEEIEKIVGEFWEKKRPLETKISEAEKQLRELREELAVIKKEEKEALSLCEHQWQLQQEDEDESGNSIKEFQCLCCDLEHTQRSWRLF